MREDLHTPTVKAAATWQRHHADPGLPASFGIAASDVEFRMAGDHGDCCGGDPDFCWGPMTAARIRAEFGGQS